MIDKASYREILLLKSSLPGYTTGLHVVGEGHVVGPDVVLPLAEAEHAAQHPPRVQTHAHVQVNLSGLHNRSKHMGKGSISNFKKSHSEYRTKVNKGKVRERVN